MPGEDIYSWSTTAASNDDADTSINWSEGQARASVNDSARSLMAATAKFRDLLKGTIITGGTTDAQTFTSGVGYTTVPTGLRALLKIGPGLTNTTTTTLSMDGITAATVKTKAGANLIGGELVAGGYVEVIFDGTNWILAADGKEKVNRSGDTMTGALTVPSLTSTGNVVVTGGVTATSLTANPVNIGSMTITSTAGSHFFQFQGNDYAMTWNGANGDIAFYAATAQQFLFQGIGNLFVAGTGLKPGGGAWTDSSDARIKNVVGNYTSSLAEIAGINPVRYIFKGNDTSAAPAPDDTIPYKTSPHKNVATSGKEFVGVVAQDIEQYLPELVTQASGYIDGAAVSDVRMIDTTPLVYALVNCVKELLVRIEALEAKGLMRLIVIPIDEDALMHWGIHWVPFLPKIASRTKETVQVLFNKVMNKEVRLALVWDDDTERATALVGIRLHYRGADLIAEWIWMAGSGRKQWQHLLGELEQLLRDAGVVEIRPLCRRGWQRLLEANGYKLTHVEMTKSLKP